MKSIGDSMSAGDCAMSRKFPDKAHHSLNNSPNAPDIRADIRTFRVYISPARRAANITQGDRVMGLARQVEDDVEERVTRLESDVSYIRSDISDIKLDIRALRGKVDDMRDELTGKYDGLKDSIAELRVEVHDSIAGLRVEMHDSVGDLRVEMRDSVAGLRVELRDSLGALRQSISQAKIWALLMGAALLGVLARGFHWI